MTKLFAVGFPRAFDEMQLAQLFGPYGDIELLTIVRDKFTNESKGFGFIHMKDAEGAANAAAALDGYDFGERKMEVRLADEKPKAPSFNKQRRPGPPGNSYNNNNNNSSSNDGIKKKRPRLSK